MDQSPESAPLRRISELSERQIECLELAAEGLTSKEIARRLGVAPSTVDNHIRTAAARLQVAGRRDAVRVFLRERTPDRELDNRAPLDESARISETRGRYGWMLPPFGGSSNRFAISHRLVMVLQIAALGTMVLAAIIFTITGVVDVLSRR